MAEALSSSSSSSSSYYYYWVLEFLLCQPVPNYIVHKIFLHLPIAPPLPLRLAKALLLRRLFSFSISEQSLLSLELIHGLNLAAGAYDRRLLPLIQSAYLHAAVGSTLAPLRNGDLPDFFDAVRRIWTMRVEDLARSEAKGLVSDGLKQWKTKMVVAAEAQARGKEMRDRVLMEWSVEEGMVAVKEYLVMELEVMGKTVLEMTAEEFLDGGARDDDCVVVEEDCVDDERVEVEGGENLSRERKSLAANGIDFGECNVLEKGGEEESRGEANVGWKGIGNGDSVSMEEGASDGLDRGEEITGGQAERAGLGVSSRRIDTAISSVPTPEVNKVKENLRKSREDLQNVVEDPLPDAKKAASRVIASRCKEVMHLEKPAENRSLNKPEQNQNAVDGSATCHSADTGATVIHNESTSGDVELNKDPNKVTSPGLMDWNPTARTYGWEDESLGSESDNSASPAKKLHLPTPRTLKVSPLKPVQFKKAARKRKRWRVEEVDALRAGVDKHGVGKWKLILNDNPSTFDERTEVDLKDKWRNLTNS